MFMLPLIFVIVCGFFRTGIKSVQVFLLFLYINIVIGDPLYINIVIGDPLYINIVNGDPLYINIVNGDSLYINIVIGDPLYINIVIGDPLIRTGGLESHNQFNPTLFLCQF